MCDHHHHDDSPLDKLMAGHEHFLKDTFAGHEDLFRALAEQGQAPNALVITCSDSRVAPNTVFAAKPGDLFVVRNIAAFVPKYQPDGSSRGTSAAIEFSVKTLKVPLIVVMGHSNCGGVKVACEIVANQERNAEYEFVDPWVRDLCPAVIPETPEEAEKMSIRQSLKNLRTFPFVAERETAGTLALVGLHFDIASGKLARVEEEE